MGMHEDVFNNLLSHVFSPRPLGHAVACLRNCDLRFPIDALLEALLSSVFSHGAPINRLLFSKSPQGHPTVPSPHESAQIISIVMKNIGQHQP